MSSNNQASRQQSAWDRRIEVSPSVFLFTSGYVNDIVNTAPEGSTIMLDRKDSWTFGPPSSNRLKFTNPRVTIMGNGSTITLDGASIIDGCVTLDDVNIVCEGTAGEDIGDYLSFIAVLGHLVIAGDVTISCTKNRTDANDVGTFHLLAVVSQPGLTIGAGNELHVFSSDNGGTKRTDRLMYLLGGTFTNNGTLMLGNRLNSGDATIEDDFTNPAITITKRTFIQSRGVVYVVGYVHFVDNGSVSSNIQRFTNLQINTGAKANASCIYLRMGDPDGGANAMLMDNLRLVIQKLSAHRDRGNGSARPAIAAVQSAALGFAAISIAGLATDIVNPVTDGYGSGDGDNRIYIARNVQTGFNNAIDIAGRYSSLCAGTAGINSSGEFEDLLPIA